MTRILGVLGTALLLAAPMAFAGDLTLRDVIELHRSGLGDDLLIAVIDADGGPFSLSLADIHDLKSDGLSERLIAALVRTGARRTGSPDDGSVPVVHVQQNVINNVVPAIVVVDTPELGRRRGGTDPDRPGHPSNRDGNEFRHRPPAPPPPATWVTRREDGKNVTDSGVVRSSAPAATWVTPRDPKVDEKPRAEGKARPR